MNNTYLKASEEDLRIWLNQLIKGEQWDDVEEYFTDLFFIEAVCGKGKELTHRLLDAFIRAQKYVQTPRFTQVWQSVIQCLDAIIDRPELCLQTLYNYLSWVSPLDPDLIEKPLLDAKERLQNFPCWIRAASPTLDRRTDKLLNIPFDFDSTVQSLAANGSALAIASPSGKVAIYDLVTGILLETKEIRPMISLALSNNTSQHYYAWIDLQKEVQSSKEGLITIMSPMGQTTLRCHPKARLLYHRTGGILTVDVDDELIAWQPINEGDPITKLKVKLAQPFTVFRFGPQNSTDQNKTNVVFVAGRENVRIGIATWDSHAWIVYSKVLDNSPNIIDADCDSSGRYLALLRKDRSIEIIEIKREDIAPEPICVFYTKESAHTIAGAPARCAYHPHKDEVIFGTTEGNIAAWNWRNKTLEKYHDYCTIMEPRLLTQLSVLPHNDEIFISFPESAQTIAPEKPVTIGKQHPAGVLDCFITATGEQVISAGKQDSRICWSTFEGLQLQATRSLGSIPKAISMIAPYHDSDTVLVGDSRGWIWRQPRDRAVSDDKEVWHLFDGPVLSGFSPEPGVAIAADKTSRILRTQLDLEDVTGEVLYHSQSWDEQIALHPTGNNGQFWSLRRTGLGTPTYVLSLFDKAGHEQIIYQSEDLINIFHPQNPANITVSADTQTVCIFGKIVYILRQSKQKWIPIEQSEMYIDFATFIDNSNHLLAIISRNSSWLEIRDIDDYWQDIAAVWLPNEATCLSTTRNRIVVGFQSGNLLSYEFITNDHYLSCI
jgi:hypothetical protein